MTVFAGIRFGNVGTLAANGNWGRFWWSIAGYALAAGGVAMGLVVTVGFATAGYISIQEALNEAAQREKTVTGRYLAKNPTVLCGHVDLDDLSRDVDWSVGDAFQWYREYWNTIPTGPSEELFSKAAVSGERARILSRQLGSLLRSLSYERLRVRFLRRRWYLAFAGVFAAAGMIIVAVASSSPSVAAVSSPVGVEVYLSAHGRRHYTYRLGGPNCTMAPIKGVAVSGDLRSPEIVVIPRVVGLTPCPAVRLTIKTADGIAVLDAPVLKGGSQ